MNILHLLPTNQFGGGEKVVLQLAKYDTYNNIYVGCGEDVTKIFEKNNIKSFSIDISKKVEVIKCIRNIVKKENIDIIHAHDNTISLLAYISKKIYKLNVKVISHIHNNYPWLAEKNVYKFIDKIFRNKYDFNIYCGEKVREYYLKYGKYIDDRKAKSISNAIEIVETKNRIKKSELELDNKFIYGFIGRITQQKGLKPFIEEVSKNKDKFKDSIFLIIGDGNQSDEIRNIIKDLNLDKYFKFIGFQEDVYQFFNIIDVVFLPSLYEGLPMIILEAMAHSKAVVSMDVGSINEVICNNETGLLIEQGRYDYFIKALVDIKENRLLKEKCEIKSKEFIKQNYDIMRQIREVNEIYKYIIKI